MLQPSYLGPYVLRWPLSMRAMHARCRRLQVPSLSGRVFGRLTAGSRLLHLVSRQWSVCSAGAASRSAPLHADSRQERRTDSPFPRGHSKFEILAKRTSSSLAETARRDISLGHRAGNACRPTAKTRARRGRNREQHRVGGSSSVGGGLGRAERAMVLDSVDEDTLPEHVPFVAEKEEDTPHGHMGKYMDAVVKVYCVHTEPNYSLPWQRKRQFATTSTGFMINSGGANRWLLTNAHSVEYHSQVKVKRRGDDRKFLAKVLTVGTECDIALMTVEDDAFWADVAPLAFGSLPHLQDAVAVVGYPVGGETISVTSGVVSRIEVTSYAHSSTELLGVQIDAAINSGNSGGPVFNQAGECVGIAFQSLASGDAENIGYVIPTPVIDHFLTDYQRNGAFTGFPAISVRWQSTESQPLRQSLGMVEGQKGVLVLAISPVSDTYNHLKPNDVILRFEGIQIASDGTVPFRSGERIAFAHLVSQKFTGQSVKLDLLRGGKELQVEILLMAPQPLVPLHLAGQDPSFLVIAGLVFTPFCEPYLQSEYGEDYISDASTKLLDKLLHGHKKTRDQQVVLLSQVLACDATLGYNDHFNSQVFKFNGVPVQNLRHLARLTAECTDPFMRFDLDYEEVVVVDTKVARAATAGILQSHSIPAAISKDLLDTQTPSPQSPPDPATDEAPVPQLESAAAPS